MLRLRSRLKKLTEMTTTQSATKYRWRAISTGLFSGLTLFLPVEWGEEVIQGQHEKEFLEVIKLIATKGGIFYDIGAHYGWFSAAWLQQGGASVEAFEPLADNRNVLEQMLYLNHWNDRVRVHAVAIGKYTGSAPLIAFPGDSSRTFIRQIEGIHVAPANATELQVPIWTLTDLVREQKLNKPDLIKIDVEGLEGDVIEGATAFLNQVRPAIIVKVHSTLNGLRAADQLSKLGYEMKLLGLKGKKKSLPLVLWTHPENPLEQIPPCLND